MMKIFQTKVGNGQWAIGNHRAYNCLLKFAYCLLLLLLLVTPYLSTAQKPIPELWGQRVHDDAHVLKQETIDALEQRLKVYEDSSSNQIAILTTLSLDGEVLEEYSLKVAEAWKLGQKDKDNGVLLLIAVDDHKMRIEVGHGLEGVLTDAHSNRIIRNEMTPNFRRGDFDAGVTAAVDAMIKSIGGEYSADDSDDLNDLTTGQRIGIGLGIFVFLGIFAFFALIAPGGIGWGIYAFLLPFYATLPVIAVGLEYWYVPLSVYAIVFPILKIWLNKSGWGQKISKKMNSSSGKGSGWSSGSSRSSGGWSSGSSGSSFSGGGGRFGGGGSSGSW
ncbi:MAG: TPM domain-containing protein [Bacteroidota bacterium]